MKDDKEEYIYAGIPTYMGGKFIKERDIKNYDIIFWAFHVIMEPHID